MCVCKREGDTGGKEIGRESVGEREQRKKGSYAEKGDRNGQQESAKMIGRVREGGRVRE